MCVLRCSARLEPRAWLAGVGVCFSPAAGFTAGSRAAVTPPRFRSSAAASGNASDRAGGRWAVAALVSRIARVSFLGGKSFLPVVLSIRDAMPLSVASDEAVSSSLPRGFVLRDCHGLLLAGTSHPPTRARSDFALLAAASPIRACSVRM